MKNCNDIEKWERANLESYACFSDTATRKIIRKKPTTRSDFQRDRDRIIYSKAFRRLEYKTQVYLTQQADHLRTRLTHSLEVAQLSRTIAYQLGLNVDLAEAIALGHDLGHTPFGHAGEKQLSKILKRNGLSFKHNVQSVRVVDNLEKKYDFEGLNLTMAVREGILKHTRFPENLPEEFSDLFPGIPFSITLEGQVVAIADEIAQATHDFDDYLRYNLFKFRKFKEHEIFKLVEDFYFEVNGNRLADYLDNFDDECMKKDITIRSLVDYLVTCIVIDSHENLKNKEIFAYELDNIYIKFNEERTKILKDFHDKFFESVLRDKRVHEMDIRGMYIVDRLFKTFRKYPKTLPEHTQSKYFNAVGKDKLIVLANHISGMTDRYAIEKFDDLCRVFLI